MQGQVAVAAGAAIATQMCPLCPWVLLCIQLEPTSLGLEHRIWKPGPSSWMETAYDVILNVHKQLLNQGDSNLVNLVSMIWDTHPGLC